MRVLAFLILFLATAAPAAAREVEWPDLGWNILEGVATPEFIWLRGNAGTVVRFDRATGERTVVATGVQDMVADGASLWVLANGPDRVATLSDIRGANGSSSRIGLDDRPVVLVNRPSQMPAVLRTTELVIPSTAPGGWTRTLLAAQLEAGAQAVATPSGDVYAGFNKGEWGGGLRRIQADGTISFVGQPNTRQCEGALNPACEPVVGLFLDPKAPECVVVGTGLSHLSTSTGRLYRVCEDTVELIWQTPLATQPDSWMLGAQPWPLARLVETPDGWIGLSRDRYFRSRGGDVTEYPMPVFQEWSGIRISEEQDGVLFIVSACCWGAVDNPTLYSTLAVPVVR